jgi:hypothetical protein
MFHPDRFEHQKINAFAKQVCHVQHSVHDLSTFKKLSIILVACVAIQLGVVFAFFLELEPFINIIFLGPQAAGSIAALWYVHRPTDRKYSPHYFVLLASLIPTMALLYWFVLVVPTALIYIDQPLGFPFFLRGIMPCIWVVSAIVYLMKVLRLA